jgi:hypothetical protein
MKTKSKTESKTLSKLKLFENWTQKGLETASKQPQNSYCDLPYYINQL